jgi:hypothetical protein
MFIEYIVLSAIGLVEVLFGLYLLYKAKAYGNNHRTLYSQVNLQCSDEATSNPKKKYKLAQLLTESDPNFPMSEDLKEWDRLEPVGKEIPGKAL